MDFDISVGGIKDLKHVIEIDYKSYEDIYPQYNRRCFNEVLSYYEKNPSGFFVAKISNEVVGFIFTRILGSFGWCGPMSVTPNFQNMGIGFKLLYTADVYLKECGCIAIGFETTPNNVSRYLKWNWIATSFTYFVKANAANGYEDTSKINIIEIHKDGNLKEFQLDLSIHGFNININLLDDIYYDLNNLGSSIFQIYYKEKYAGYVIANFKGDSLVVKYLFLESNNINVIKETFSKLKEISLTYGLKTIMLPINSGDLRTLDCALDENFNICSYSIRMQSMYSKELINNKSVFLWHWGT